MNIPSCFNATEGICPRSATFVEGEREIDGKKYFVIRCRTCNGINIFPHEAAEKCGRLAAELKKHADITAQRKALESRTKYFT